MSRIAGAITALVMCATCHRAHSAETVRVVPRGPAGVMAVKQWQAEWPGCAFEDGVTEGRLSTVTTEGGPAYRVDYALGGIGPEQGGVGWRFPMGRADVAELHYAVTFSRDFEWVKGGKLPGLCGGPESVTGGNPATGTNGFSVRPMWRADGRGEAYVYHMHQPGKYGESLPFPKDFRFPTEVTVRVRIRVAMNTPGRRNGRFDLWVGLPEADERHVVSRADMEWRSTPEVAIDGLLFETFHGGGDRSWAPRRPSFTLFRDIVVELSNH